MVSQVGVMTGASVGSGARVSATGASVDAIAAVVGVEVSVEPDDSSPPQEASAINPATASVAPIRNEEHED